jgi:hypothetical protein
VDIVHKQHRNVFIKTKKIKFICKDKIEIDENGNTCCEIIGTNALNKHKTFQ